jgi:hypothetical protein
MESFGLASAGSVVLK